MPSAKHFRWHVCLRAVLCLEYDADKFVNLFKLAAFFTNREGRVPGPHEMIRIAKDGGRPSFKECDELEVRVTT